MNIDPSLEYLEGLNLVAPVSFWESTPEDREPICNGAGAAGGMKFPSTFWGLNVREAFDIHDWDYAIGGNALARLRADTNMLINCERLVESRTTRFPVVGFILRWLRGVRANTYYRAVRDFGHDAFNTK